MALQQLGGNDPATADRVVDRHARRVDLGLTTLLLIQGFTLFVAIPLSSLPPGGHLLLDGCHVAFALICVGVLSRHRGVHLCLLLALAVLIGGPPLGRLLGADLDLSPERQRALIAVAAFGFNGAVTALVAFHVFAPGSRITVHRIRGAMLLYLNVAALFAIAYGWIAASAQGAFAGYGRPLPAHAALGIAQFTYFSLSTITTTGFGDITPIHPLARSLANLEGVFGQLFPATLLSRLVSLHLIGASRTADGGNGSKGASR